MVMYPWLYSQLVFVPWEERGIHFTLADKIYFFTDGVLHILGFVAGTILYVHRFQPKDLEMHWHYVFLAFFGSYCCCFALAVLGLMMKKRIMRYRMERRARDEQSRLKEGRLGALVGARRTISVEGREETYFRVGAWTVFGIGSIVREGGCQDATTRGAKVWCKSIVSDSTYCLGSIEG